MRVGRAAVVNFVDGYHKLTMARRALDRFLKMNHEYSQDLFRAVKSGALPLTPAYRFGRGRLRVALDDGSPQYRKTVKKLAICL